VTNKEGTIYIDDIYFTPKVIILEPISDEEETPSEDHSTPGPEAIFTIAGLLAVASILRRRR